MGRGMDPDRSGGGFFLLRLELLRFECHLGSSRILKNRFVCRIYLHRLGGC